MQFAKLSPSICIGHLTHGIYLEWNFIGVASFLNFCFYKNIIISNGEVDNKIILSKINYICS